MATSGSVAAPNTPVTDRYVRATLVCFGVVVALAALGFAASYVDRGYDQTCGSLLEPVDIYGTCQSVLHVRAAIAFVMVGLACLLIIRGCLGRPIGRGWLVLAGVSLAGSAVVLIVNEAVRSGGLL